MTAISTSEFGIHCSSLQPRALSLGADRAITALTCIVVQLAIRKNQKQPLPHGHSFPACVAIQERGFELIKRLLHNGLPALASLFFGRLLARLARFGLFDYFLRQMRRHFFIMGEFHLKLSSPAGD